MKRKFLVTLLVVTMTLGLFTGCGKETGDNNGGKSQSKENVEESQSEEDVEFELAEETIDNDETEELANDDETEEMANNDEPEPNGLYSPDISDDMKDEVLGAYQKYMDDNGFEECIMFGMDTAEFPLLYILGNEGSNGNVVALYCNGEISTIKPSWNITIDPRGQIRTDGWNESGGDHQEYYGVQDGKITLLHVQSYIDGDFKQFDGNGNEVEHFDLPDLDTDEFEDKYERKYTSWAGSYLKSVKEAYRNRNHTITSDCCEEHTLY